MGEVHFQNYGHAFWQPAGVNSFLYRAFLARKVMPRKFIILGGAYVISFHPACF